MKSFSVGRAVAILLAAFMATIVLIGCMWSYASSHYLITDHTVYPDKVSTAAAGSSRLDSTESGSASATSSSGTAASPSSATGSSSGAVPTMARDALPRYAGEVALYLHIYGELPGNYVTKSEARAAGWDSGEDLWDYLPGLCIGGDRFYNYEGSLPDAAGRTWYEADVNYNGGKRGAARLLFSTDGLIYYTTDHYQSFEQLY